MERKSHTNSTGEDVEGQGGVVFDISEKDPFNGGEGKWD